MGTDHGEKGAIQGYVEGSYGAPIAFCYNVNQSILAFDNAMNR
jgi:hypothetical protein